LGCTKSSILHLEWKQTNFIAIEWKVTHKEADKLKAEFTAIIEPAPEGGFWAICPEVTGANGQEKTVDEAKESLRQAIELILEDRRADILRGLPSDAIQDKVTIG
jgi:predicted RNase H-like HicB family nuclease